MPMNCPEGVGGHHSQEGGQGCWVLQNKAQGVALGNGWGGGAPSHLAPHPKGAPPQPPGSQAPMAVKPARPRAWGGVLASLFTCHSRLPYPRWPGPGPQGLS